MLVINNVHYNSLLDPSIFRKKYFAAHNMIAETFLLQFSENVVKILKKKVQLCLYEYIATNFSLVFLLLLLF